MKSQRTLKPGSKSGVTVVVGKLELPTYMPAAPDPNPMFLEKRVYQGSSGRVYPLPMTDRISEQPVNREWKAIWIENEFLRVLVLPEIGGRIHAIQDKTNGYDLIYNQHVIKPALVGLAGPWISGGIEFNWPQHHRPATFLPVDYDIEEHSDGSKTIWCSDHDPMARMKGMHGVCLHPGRAVVELKVRAYNRTPFLQTFLWWANVATRVHESYQSFFPPDVHYVADHARRSMSEYPLAQGFYYGVNYGQRGRSGIPTDEIPRQFIPAHCGDARPRSDSGYQVPDYAPNDLSFYANIPVPTSYMCMGSSKDFFGGYDYAARAGIVHVANHHISPGKKQWTWGNHEFGYAWDRNLTDADSKGEYGPYIEIMAGVYTDNQPDFSFLEPGETKSWSQFWYPIREIGPVHHANQDAAIRLSLDTDRFQVGVCVTRAFPRAVVRLESADGSGAAEWDADLLPGKPWDLHSRQARKPWKPGETVLRVLDCEGKEIISWQSCLPARGKVPPAATEPAPPAEMRSSDELYVTGLHLEQYRHATRCPTLYWREALKRDPLDSRCNNALGMWHLRRGEFPQAESCFRRAIERITRRNANPLDGRPYYNLGLCLTYHGRENDAYAAFYKSCWDQACMAAGYHALAELDCKRQAWSTALEHLGISLRHNTDNTRARDLMVMVLRRQNRSSEAEAVLEQTLMLDRLDWWGRHLRGESLACDLQTALDLAHDNARAGFYAEAIEILDGALKNSSSRADAAGSLPDQSLGALPLVYYTKGWLELKRGNAQAGQMCFKQAASASPEYCFPARLEEIAVLGAAMAARPGDARAPYYLGNLLYDRRRHLEAIRLWEQSARLDPDFSVVWRNLAIGYFNILHRPDRARACYDRAIRANPRDARLLYERDHLWKRLRVGPRERLHAIEARPELASQRDDLSVELCALYNQTGRHEKALRLVGARKFQPWEGGEGGPLGQHERSHLALGRAALAQGNPAEALKHFEAALTAPVNLGEAKHLLANRSDLHYWLGAAFAALKNDASARRHWLAAATFKGDFQEMKVRAYSEMTYYSALSWKQLGQKNKARKLLLELLAYSGELKESPAKIDYFATSLPTMLLFEDDLQYRQQTSALFLEAQALMGLGKVGDARRILKTVLRRDPNHALASDFLAASQTSQSRRTRSPHS